MPPRDVEKRPGPGYLFEMIVIGPPALVTLSRKPSWLNRSGRVDRSACVELRASDIWRLVAEHHWRSCGSQRQARTREHATHHHDAARSAYRAGRLRPHREAFALFTITARLLARLHETRGPLQLAGDFRSVKSNAMNTHYRDSRTSIARNPNRGGMRIKKLGVWDGCDAGDEHSPRLRTGWTQAVRLERWRLHARLAQHFLICPCCQRKHLKLFMPLATQKEVEDARLAEGWVRMLDARQTAGRIALDREHLVLRARMIERYGPLFRTGGRELRCRACLGVRYGEVKWIRHAAREAQLRAEREHSRACEQAQRAAGELAAQERLHGAMREMLGPERLQRAMDELHQLRQQRQEHHRRRAARRNRRQHADRHSRDNEGNARTANEASATKSQSSQGLEAFMNRRGVAHRQLAKIKTQLAKALLLRATQLDRTNNPHHPPK